MINKAPVDSSAIEKKERRRPIITEDPAAFEARLQREGADWITLFKNKSQLRISAMTILVYTISIR
jgi:hypothetical protein